MMKWLINHGIDINAKNIDGKTALHLSTCPINTKNLIDCGADTHVKDNEGNLPKTEEVINKLNQFINILNNLDFNDPVVAEFGKAFIGKLNSA